MLAYLVLSGWPPPAERSAVTAAVAFGAILVDRQAISLHALALAALVVLLLQPEAVTQPGFQMSFAATAALVALAEVWPHPVREINTPWPIRILQGFWTWTLAGAAASFVAGHGDRPFRHAGLQPGLHLGPDLQHGHRADLGLPDDAGPGHRRGADAFRARQVAAARWRASPST